MTFAFEEVRDRRITAMTMGEERMPRAGRAVTFGDRRPDAGCELHTGGFGRAEATLQR